MPPEQTFQIVAIVATGLFGAGGAAAIVGHLVTRKLGLKTNETEANKVINSTWEAIVEDLQGQIASGRQEFKDQLTYITGEVQLLKAAQKELEIQLGHERRLVLTAISHINRQDNVIVRLGGEPLDRPEGLE